MIKQSVRHTYGQGLTFQGRAGWDRVTYGRARHGMARQGHIQRRTG